MPRWPKNEGESSDVGGSGSNPGSPVIEGQGDERPTEKEVDKPSEPTKKKDVAVTPLTPLKNGNFGVFINGKLLGEISAFPVTGLVLQDNPRQPTVLNTGTHTLHLDGKTYRVTVKDLKLVFMNDERREIAADLNMKGIKLDDYVIDKHIKEAQDNNEKAKAELLGRVVVEPV